MSEDTPVFDADEKRAQLRRILQQGRPALPQGPVGAGGPVPPGGRLEDAPEIRSFGERMDQLAGLGLQDPCFRTVEGPAAGTVRIDGRTLIDFSGYNYLGLAGDPRVKRAAQEAIERFGTSASASRLASGERPLHRELERAIADFLGVDDAVVFTSGYATNVSLLGHVLGPRDLIVHDELAHNSIIVGAHLSRARRLFFPHDNWEALDSLLRRHGPEADKKLIAIEGAYSMDGDIPDLPRLIELKRRHGAILYVDEAHSLGVVGPSGRGIGEHFGVDRREVELWMGTLSKTLASVGGYVAGSARLIRYLKYTLPGFIFSAGMPPGNAAAARAALRLMQDEPWRLGKLRENAGIFLDEARAAGIDTGLSEGTAVVPAIIGDSMRCLRLSGLLFEEGVNVFPMTYPAVAEDQARLRFFVNAEHTAAQIRRTVAAVTTCRERLR